MLTVNYKDPLVRAYKNTMVFNSCVYSRKKPKGKRELTETELKVLDFLLAGINAGEIAILLGVNKTTANARVKAVYKYFGAVDQLDLIVGLVGEGYVSWQLAQKDIPPEPTCGCERVMNESTMNELIAEYQEMKNSGKQPTLRQLIAYSWRGLGFNRQPTIPEIMGKSGEPCKCCDHNRTDTPLVRKDIRGGK